MPRCDYHLSMSTGALARSMQDTRDGGQLDKDRKIVSSENIDHDQWCDPIQIWHYGLFANLSLDSKVVIFKTEFRPVMSKYEKPAGYGCCWSKMFILTRMTNSTVG